MEPTTNHPENIMNATEPRIALVAEDSGSGWTYLDQKRTLARALYASGHVKQALFLARRCGASLAVHAVWPRMRVSAPQRGWLLPLR